ncbi:RNA polymerase sporulation sigma factor SigK [Sedimentibacter sp. zth1]|uniref:RNA polymerase sporulation sigma factor SigK n=1 Tax=Sedimentibacter sp. zth1 TaxID=2816908 RepID=UPI001A932C3F|nr:RNA polymerase sporulation sigma factor SigK [Sedimentibacter sp. zth1]QSX06444.1 RNA polymerase sporulation sigma factor SigK [Sedimentibacter sp. zth1]
MFEQFLQFIFPFTILLFGYITNGSSFPQPLEKDEEFELIEKSRLGDLEARNILVERNLRLVAHVVKKYKSVNIDPEDLISIGTIGLIKAVTTFDNNKGIRLATYAAKCIDNEILMTLRSDKKLRNEISLHEPLGTDKDGNSIYLIDIIKYECEEVVGKIDKEQKIGILNKIWDKTLQDRERMIIEYRYGINNNDHKTQREIAKMLGISRSYVSRIEKKALKKLYDGLMAYQTNQTNKNIKNSKLQN